MFGIQHREKQLSLQVSREKRKYNINNRILRKSIYFLLLVNCGVEEAKQIYLRSVNFSAAIISMKAHEK